MAKRTISIDEKSYRVISEFCKQHTLVMSAWVEKMILDKIKELETNK
jgi:hypothetical protein